VTFVIGGGGGNRTRVRKYSAFGSTCLADSISLIDCYPNGRENNQRFRKVLASQYRTDIIAILCESTPVTGRISTHRADGTLLGIKQRVRSCRRWQLKCCRWIYEVFCTSACPLGFATHVETRNAPGNEEKYRVKQEKLPSLTSSCYQTFDRVKIKKVQSHLLSRVEFPQHFIGIVSCRQQA
jgi:hypothetical protein